MKSHTVTIQRLTSVNSFSHKLQIFFNLSQLLWSSAGTSLESESLNNFDYENYVQLKVQPSQKQFEVNGS